MYTANDIESYFFPIVATRGDESLAALLAKWDKLDTLAETSKDKLTSQKSAEAVRGISSAFNLNREQATVVAIAIRSYYFGELQLPDMPSILAKEIPIDFQKAKEITRMVIEKIINDNSQEVSHQTQLANLTLTDALKAYPELGEQLITSEKISLRNFPEPVRPSIKNWLADYTFTIGYDNKDSIKRNNYLFHSQNTLRLTSPDRQKLSHVLKAQDDGSEITVNKNLKQLVFPAANPAPAVTSQPPIPNPAYRPLSREPRRVEPIPRIPNQNKPFPPAGGQAPTFQKSESAVWPKTPPASPQNSASLHGNVSFSSAQKLPYEKVNPIQSLPQQTAAEPQPDNANSDPYIIRPVFGHTEEPTDSLQPLPKNVVNLKDNFFQE